MTAYLREPHVMAGTARSARDITAATAKQDAPPDSLTRAQSEGLAGSPPEDGVPASGVRDRATSKPSEGTPFATMSDAGERAATRNDPASASDGRPLTRKPGLPPDGAEGQFLGYSHFGGPYLLRWVDQPAGWLVVTPVWPERLHYPAAEPPGFITSHIPVTALASLPLAHDDSDEVRS